MPISNPGIIQERYFIWSLKGKPRERWTNIHLLNQGRWARVLRQFPDLREMAMLELEYELIWRAPVDTGRLLGSIHLARVGKWHASIGPVKYNRAAVKARQAGRVYKQKGPGRPRLTGYYAFDANWRSRRKGYLEGAIRAVSRRMEGVAIQLDKVDRQRRGLGI